MSKEWKRIRVEMDMVTDGTSFEAYTKGERWNGFATPFFTREEGLRLMEMMSATNKLNGIPEDSYHYFYTADDGIDAFITQDDDQVKDGIFEQWDVAEERGPNGEKLYPIGAWAWVWTEVEILPEFSSNESHVLTVGHEVFCPYCGKVNGKVIHLENGRVKTQECVHLSEIVLCEGDSLCFYFCEEVTL